ncbi:hypothetical protein BKA62DRAFT_622416 [Auriculariales sp. MPI-PUGE-AT-0066]|nr:hypothetical protein BKA62DRAFT_622416 [Auriculariales sp. MPI-PUGE-AT-0066]
MLSSVIVSVCLTIVVAIRAVEPADGDWVYSVKGDPRVNKYQLYGQPASKADANASFARGYIRDRIPILRFAKNVGGAHERLRYVFAISPKSSAIPKPASNDIPRAKGLPPFTPLPHEDTTYIGNIAFEVTPLTDVIRGEQKTISSGPPCLRIPPDNMFIWPDLADEKVRKELDGWAALMFYEIAPQYWGQGLMNEAILAVSEFVFFELGLGHVAIDPQTGNSSSIALARKFPDMEYMSTIQCRMSSAIHQHVFVASRDNYIKRFGRPSIETLPAGKRGCAWCYNPRAGVRGDGELCAGCKKRWYCGIECRAADWEVDGGHGQRCKRS